LPTNIRDGVHHPDSGHDHRATPQTAISNIEINARRPPAQGYGKSASSVSSSQKQEFKAKSIGPARALALDARVREDDSVYFQTIPE
jgi:hypothetical protein